jgi:hypothetical protein
MGKDHVNSNDNGKGADIFNDVPGMVEKIIRRIEKGIKDIEDHSRGYAGIEKVDVSGFEATGKKIAQLRRTVASFNEKREHQTYRTADGGSGDPENANKFSMLSRDTVAGIERLCSIKPEAWDNTYELGKMRNSDWNVVARCRKFRDGSYVKEHTFDQMAYGSRKTSLAGDKKLAKGFDEWYMKSEALLLQTFEELTEVVEHFRETKNSILRKRKKDVLGPRLPQPFNNGGDANKFPKPDNGREARVKEARKLTNG